MIKITNYDQINNYFNLPDGTIDFLRKIDESTPNGTYTFSDDCFIKVMDAKMSEPSGAMEAHDVYVDVQCLFTGEERIYYRPRTGLRKKTEYNEDGDYTFFYYKESPFVDYKAGECIIFYPEDAHMPGCAINGDIVAKKAVIKINADKLIIR